MNACDCCEQPPCPAPSLEFVSSSLSGTLCGFPLPEHPDNTEAENCLRFTTRVSSKVTSYNREAVTFVDFVEVPLQEDGLRTDTYTETSTDTGEECVVTFESSAIWHEYSLTTLTDGRKYPETTIDYSSSSSSAAPACVGTQTNVTTYESDPAEPEDTSTTTGEWGHCAEVLTPGVTWSKVGYVYTLSTDFPLSEGETGSHNETQTVTLSGEATLPAEDFPDYPAWEGESEDALVDGQGRTSVAEREGCGSVNLTKIKYRFKHLPTGTCYLKAWVSKVFTPAGEDPETPEITTYVWTGAGNPCLTVEFDPVDANTQLIHGTATEILPPAAEGTIAITLVKYSCVEGYEPDLDDPTKPNGFPDPSPAAP